MLLVPLLIHVQKWHILWDWPTWDNRVLVKHIKVRYYLRQTLEFILTFRYRIVKK